MKSWLHALLISAIAFPWSVSRKLPPTMLLQGLSFLTSKISNGRKPILS